MDARSRRHWHRKRRRLKQIEERAGTARKGGKRAGRLRPLKRPVGSAGPLRRLLDRLSGRRTAEKPLPRMRPFVDPSDPRSWSWEVDPDPAHVLVDDSASQESATAETGLPSFEALRAARPIRSKRAARAADRPRSRARGNLRRLVAFSLLFGIFAPAIPVALLRFVPPLASTLMVQRWWEARAEARAFDLQYEWVSLDEIARSLRAAVVVSEDQRFHDHAGFDLKELRNALEDWRNGDSLRGASTISQQVAKNLFLWPGRSFLRKLIEAWFTLWIEWLWPKERILEVYLNVAELGDGVFGAEAASRRYFERPAAKLVPHESALLAAMLPSPLRSNPKNPSEYLRKRQRWILRQL